MNINPGPHRGGLLRCLSLFTLAALLAGPAVTQGSSPGQNHRNPSLNRPAIPPGGSNWVPQTPAVPGLATQDLGTGLTPEALVQALVGAGVTVSNVTYVGLDHTAGTFDGGTGIVGFEAGVVLSSGNVASVAGPMNVDDGTTTNNGMPGDTDLDSLIPGYTSYDATVLEFDFECPEAEEISFQYVFCSEEYNEYVDSSFNDVFGFFLNGANIALIPGTTEAVAINNVNCGNPYSPPGGANCGLYRNNDCTDIPPGTFPCADIASEMDGFTTVFSAVGPLQPGVNHIKLAIADAGDYALDSNVFLRGSSFQCGAPGPVFDPPTPCGQLVGGPCNSTIEFDVVALATNGFADQSVVLSVDGDLAPLLGGVFTPPLPTPPLQPAITHFSWTPTALDIGIHTLVFTATDQLQLTEECTVMIEVTDCEGGGDVDLGCAEFDRFETLTPEDTFTALTVAHNPNQAQGFFYVAAVDADGDPIGFDYLTGQLMILDGLEAFEYAVNAVDYRAAVGQGVETDIDSDGIRDLNGSEYEKTAGELLIPRFMGQSSPDLTTPFSSELILIALSGGTKFTTTVDFLIFNDNEQMFSSEFSFDCWDKVSLREVSGAFTSSFLADGTDDDPDEILGAKHYEAGWFKMNGAVATSTVASIQDPAVYGMLLERGGGMGVADLPFEICLQKGHLLPRHLYGDNEEADQDLQDCAVNLGRREPGSLLLFPEFDNRHGIVSMLTVTNVHPSDEVRVHFVYYGKYGF